MIRGNKIACLANEMHFVNVDKDVFIISGMSDAEEVLRIIKNDYASKDKIASDVVVISANTNAIYLVDIMCAGVTNFINVEESELNNLSIISRSLDELSDNGRIALFQELADIELSKEQIVGLLIMLLKPNMFGLIPVLTSPKNYGTLQACDEFVKNIDASDEEIQQLQNEIARLKENAESQSDDQYVNELKAELENTKEELERTKAESANINEQAAALLQVFNDKNNEVISLQTEIERMKETTVNVEDNTSLKEIEEKYNSAKEEVSRLGSVIEHLNEEVSLLTTQLETASKANDSQDRLAELDQLVESLKAEKESNAQKVSQLTEEVERLTTDKDGYASALEEANEKLNTVNQQLTEALARQEEYESIKTQLAEKEEELRVAKENTEVSQANESTIIELSNTISELREKLENSESLCQTLQGDLGSKNAELESSLKSVEDLTAEKNSLIQQIAELESKLQADMVTSSEDYGNLQNALIVGGVNKKELMDMDNHQLIKKTIAHLNQQNRNEKNGAIPAELVEHYENQAKENQKLLNEFNLKCGRLEDTNKSQELLIMELQKKLKSQSADIAEHTINTVGVDTAKYNQLKEEYDKLVSSTNSRIKYLEDELSKKDDHILELEEADGTSSDIEVDKLKAEKDQIQNELEDLKVNYELLLQEKDNFDMTHSELESKAMELETNKAELVEKITELEEELAELKVKYEEKEKQLNDASDSIKAAELEVESLKSNQESTNNFDDNSELISELNKQIRETSDKLGQLKLDYNELSTSSIERENQLKAEIEKLQEDIQEKDELLGNVEILIKQKVDEAVAITKQESAELEGAVDSLEKQVSSMALTTNEVKVIQNDKPTIDKLITNDNLMNAKSIYVMKELISAPHLEDILVYMMSAVLLGYQNAIDKPVMIILDPMANESRRKKQYLNNGISVNELNSTPGVPNSYIVATDYNTFIELKEFNIHMTQTVIIVDRYEKSVVSRKDARYFDILASEDEKSELTGAEVMSMLDIFPQNYNSLVLKERLSTLIRIMPFSNILNEINEAGKN